MRKEGLPLFPVTKYSVNKLINKLNNKCYMSLITYRELSIISCIVFQMILTTFSHDSFIFFHLSPFPLDPRVLVFAHQIDLLIYP